MYTRMWNDFKTDLFFLQEKEAIIQKWSPDELVGDVPENHLVLTNNRIVTAMSGKQITINSNNCLNLATHNYMGLLNAPDIKDSAIAAVRKYGVGSCGPRGFYGTIGKIKSAIKTHFKPFYL